MDSLDELIVTSIDNEKALRDFKVELADILNIDVKNIVIDYITDTLHSSIKQYLSVNVKDKTVYTKRELNRIPFTEINLYNTFVEFIFDVGEACI